MIIWKVPCASTRILFVGPMVVFVVVRLTLSVFSAVIDKMVISLFFYTAGARAKDEKSTGTHFYQVYPYNCNLSFFHHHLVFNTFFDSAASAL